jgi:pimeloyl-ACP methyl ester carboxylesterase
MSLVGPGSFLEVRKILPLLVEASPEHPSFHVVAVSLPGYGFSEAPKKKGFGATQYAEVGNKLMLALGYNEYGTEVLAILHLDPAHEFTYQSHKAATGAP